MYVYMILMMSKEELNQLQWKKKKKRLWKTFWDGNRESQIQAALELSRLSSKRRHKLEESGVMVPLVFMLHSQDYEAIEAALCALLSLSFGSERLVHHSPSNNIHSKLHPFLLVVHDTGNM